MAEKIKQIARHAGVPILENRSLARGLFKATKVGQEIPAALYQAAAEVLAYVYRLTATVRIKLARTSRWRFDSEKLKLDMTACALWGCSVAGGGCGPALAHAPATSSVHVGSVPFL